MLSTCSTFDAKNRLGRLLDRVQAGEVVVITRHGQPVAKLVPATTSDAESLTAVLSELKQVRDLISRRGIKITRNEVRRWKQGGRR